MSFMPLLEAVKVSKHFGGTQALADVSLSVSPGEIHALVGQNGSGKSTLIKILAGYYSMDAGTIRVRGNLLGSSVTASRVRSNGLAFLHQDLALAPGLTVLENVRVGRLVPSKLYRVRWRSERAHVRQLLDSIGLGTIDPDVLVGSLSPAEKALIGLARALQDMDGIPGVLILDEPTAYLSQSAVEVLFTAVREVASSGSGVLFVTHRIDEVFSLADRVSVIRNGVIVLTCRVKEISRRELVRTILGKDLDEFYPAPTEARREGKPVISVRGLDGESVRSISFDVRSGEVLGLTGLIGMGHDQIPALVFGDKPATAGEVIVGGSSYSASSLTPGKCKRLGIAFLPADRTKSSGVLNATVRENASLPRLSKYWSNMKLNLHQERLDISQLLGKFQVTPPHAEMLLSALSGGNQQKVLLGKWLETAPKILLLHEPTQGVDIGARKEIFQIMKQEASNGMAIVIASSEYEDLANLCDRVLILRNGEIIQELSGEDLTEERIVEQCYLADDVK